MHKYIRHALIHIYIICRDRNKEREWRERERKERGERRTCNDYINKAD